MASNSQTIKDFDIGTAERVARIIGPQSAAAQALADRARRIEAGEDPVIIYSGSTWLVVPRSVTMEMMGS